jgi:hypothetical protein
LEGIESACSRQFGGLLTEFRAPREGARGSHWSVVGEAEAVEPLGALLFRIAHHTALGLRARGTEIDQVVLLFEVHGISPEVAVMAMTGGV